MPHKIHARSVDMNRIPAPKHPLTFSMIRADEQRTRTNSSRPHISSTQASHAHVQENVRMREAFLFWFCGGAAPTQSDIALLGIGAPEIEIMSSSGWCPGPDDGSLAET